MRQKQAYATLFLLLLIVGLWSCKTSQQWAGQAPIRIVPTNTLPIQKQQLGTFDLGQGVYASNDFVGARLNGITRGDDGKLLALITPENTPINPSPWYSFKLWAEEEQEVSLKLSYLNGSFHRYHPLLSRDGKSWQRLSEDKYQRGALIDNEFLDVISKVRKLWNLKECQKMARNFAPHFAVLSMYLLASIIKLLLQNAGIFGNGV